METIRDGLVRADRARGLDPTQTIERLLDATTELAHRDAYEASEFVTAWSDNVARLEAHHRDPFGAAIPKLVDAMRLLATVQPTAKLAYLDPILDLYEKQCELTVVTLNYDRVLETAAEARGIKVDDGLGKGAERQEVTFTPGQLHLVKLHGSVDWVEVHASGAWLRARSRRSNARRAWKSAGGRSTITVSRRCFMVGAASFGLTGRSLIS